jgi:hypothetical protein
VTCGDFASFQTRACSRPPEPTTRTFIRPHSQPVPSSPRKPISRFCPRDKRDKGQAQNGRETRDRLKMEERQGAGSKWMSAGFSVEAADTGRLIGIQILQRDRLFWPLAGAEVDGAGRCAEFGDGGLLKSGEPGRRLQDGGLESIRRVLLAKKAQRERS